MLTKEGGFYDAAVYGKSRRDRRDKKITGKDEIRQHLAELGLVLAESVRVVNEVNGNLIVQVNETAVIKRLHGEGPLKRRIMDMGLTKGVEVMA